MNTTLEYLPRHPRQRSIKGLCASAIGLFSILVLAFGALVAHPTNTTFWTTFGIAGIASLVGVLLGVKSLCEPNRKLVAAILGMTLCGMVVALTSLGVVTHLFVHI